MSERGEWQSWPKTQHSENYHDIWSHHFMANRWGNNGNSDRLYFPGLQNQFRWWLQPWNKRCLLLGRKAMTSLDSILKSRDITLLTNVHLIKATVFPSSHVCICNLYIKKVECWRIDAFELWCWRRLFFFFFFFICGGFCHTLKWNSQGFTCVPHPNPPPTSLSTHSL